VIALFVLAAAASLITLAVVYIASMFYMRRLSAAARARARHRAATAAHGLPLADLLAAFERSNGGPIPELEQA
jgi:hypothetical protein